jgi:sulfite reductase (ferredoxin)
MEKINPQQWKADLPDFREKTALFYAGQMDKAAYKGFSGLYGSYAQRDGKTGMLRLRMTAGRVTPKKLAFVADAIRRYPVPRAHFTTCQSIQLHDLDGDTICAVMEEALDADIVTMGGGGDYPRNVMCSPLSGVEEGEYFDVMPYAQEAAAYLMHLIKAEKMPRKLKVGFSNSKKNLTHATFRDLGFAAREDGCFDVFAAGGLGNNPRFGVQVAQGVAPDQILYYIKAMWLTFRAHGNYENRGRARTRYMVQALGGEEGLKKAYWQKLDEVRASGEALTIQTVERTASAKRGDGSRVEDRRALLQKQPGLYAVCWHPIGGQPDVKTLCALSDAVADMPDVEMRLAPDESAYLVNLTGDEARRVLDITADSARTCFETSVCCIGGATCQVGLRDSQGLLARCVQAVRDAQIPDGALPQMHISGCPSSCGTHQTGKIGLRGASRNVDGKAQSAFILFDGGCDVQGCETMGRELCALLEADIPSFLVTLGRTVADSGLSYDAWREKNPLGVEEAAKDYLR